MLVINDETSTSSDNGVKEPIHDARIPCDVIDWYGWHISECKKAKDMKMQQNNGFQMSYGYIQIPGNRNLNFG